MDPSSLFLLATLAQSVDVDTQKVDVRYTEIDFGEYQVTADLIRPTGCVLFERKRAEFAPLIALRQDFNAEIADSTAQIR